MIFAFNERPFSGNTYRPRPEVYMDANSKTLIIATPWGPREAARKAIDRMNEYLVRAREDQEATTIFKRLSNLSDQANRLRIATMLANDILYREENKDEYRCGVELFAGVLEQDEFVWLQTGNPQILLSRHGKGLLPLGSQIDHSFDFSEGSEILPGLPSQMLGLDPTLNVTLNSFRARPGDKLALISHSHLPETVFTLNNLTTDALCGAIAKSSPDHAFWVGLLQIGETAESKAS